MNRKKYGIFINTAKCFDCKACMIACKVENRVPKGFWRNWVKHTGGDEGLRTGFQPGQCMQCDNPSCVAACPVNATYKENDGLVAINPKACIGCGNDGGIPFVYPGGMAFEMALSQKIGIKPAEILKMATINNAKILRKSDELGSIKKGKAADLVVLKANPLDDITNVKHIEKVIFEGQVKYEVPESVM